MARTLKVNPTVQKDNSSSFLGISNAAILVLFVFLSYLLYKNISYPLLFNDEADTTVNAQQILKYGYPKGHDEKNTIFITDNPLMLGYKASKDANISITWGNYFFGTIGVWSAKFTDDIYKKTALIRIPFVTAGLLGLVIFILAFQGFFSDKLHFRLFAIFFLLITICSVNLFLHMREARYYSLVIFICASFFYVFIQKFIHHKYSIAKYLTLMVLVMVIAYNINFIVFIVMCMTLCLYEGIAFFQRLFSGNTPGFVVKFKESFLNLLPVLISCVLISPLLVFFETFSTASKASEYYQFSSDVFWTNLSNIFHVLSKHEIFYVALIVKGIHLLCLFSIGRKKIIKNDSLKNLESVSFFILLFFCLFAGMTARMPFLFTRYFIVLQPIITLVILIDSIILLQYISFFVSKKSQKMYRIIYLISVVLICLINLNKKENHITEYLYQLSHQYKGPLDVLIPFIKEKYPHPENLVLATNYEEGAYIYYLGCKVILGYNNGFITLTEDSLKKYDPDILIFRKKWGHDPGPYNYYIQHGKYERTSFPVVDWPVNNLADLEFFVKHQFKTLMTNDDKEKSDIFIKAIN